MDGLPFFEIDQFTSFADEINISDDPLISGFGTFIKPATSGSTLLFNNNPIDKNALDCYIPESQNFEYASSSSSSSDGYTNNLQVHVDNINEYFIPNGNIKNQKERYVPIKPSAELVNQKMRIDARESRKIKNRYYAQVSRDKKKQQEADILEELGKLRQENEILKLENCQLRMTIQELSTNNGSTPPTPVSENSPPVFEKTVTTTMRSKTILIAGTIVVFCLVMFLAPNSTPSLHESIENAGEMAVLHKALLKRPNRLTGDEIIEKNSFNISNIPPEDCDLKGLNATEVGGSSDFLANASQADRNHNLDKLATIIRQKRDSVYILNVKDYVITPQSKNESANYVTKMSLIVSSSNQTTNNKSNKKN